MTVQLELDFDGFIGADPRRLRRRVRALTDELLAVARRRWPGAPLPPIRVEFRLRGHAAGEACTDSNTTNYNGDLLDCYGERFVRAIVPHEVAHIVADRIHGRRVRPHGPEWRTVVRFFGADPAVHHDFETKPARRVRLFPYRCRCGTIHELSKKAHLRARRGTVVYTCRACRAPLEFAGP